MPLLGRRRWDPQPTAQAAVLLASSGAPFSRAALRRARELAGGEPVAVLSILKIYGSSFGLPNPGLMPTRREREEQLQNVTKAINELERRGCAADGQVAATRSAGRTIAKVARTRQVRYVVMDEHPVTGIRRIIEGQVASTVRRGLRNGAGLELVGEKP
jgi:nucleotide-binding universal stress UspA family protein